MDLVVFDHPSGREGGRGPSEEVIFKPTRSSGLKSPSPCVHCIPECTERSISDALLPLSYLSRIIQISLPPPQQERRSIS